MCEKILGNSCRSGHQQRGDVGKATAPPQRQGIVVQNEAGPVPPACGTRTSEDESKTPLGTQTSASSSMLTSRRSTGNSSALACTVDPATVALAV